MDKLGFLHPPLATTLDLAQFTIRPGEDRLGVMTGTERETDAITIRGYALQTVAGRPADAILITCNDGTPKGRQIVEAVMPDNLPAFYSLGTMKDWQYVVHEDYRPKRFGEWTATIRRDAMPKGAKIRIEAWTLNMENGIVKEIGQGFSINN